MERGKRRLTLLLLLVKKSKSSEPGIDDLGGRLKKSVGWSRLFSLLYRVIDLWRWFPLYHDDVGGFPWVTMMKSAIFLEL